MFTPAPQLPIPPCALPERCRRKGKEVGTIRKKGAIEITQRWKGEQYEEETGMRRGKETKRWEPIAANGCERLGESTTGRGRGTRVE
jgi:hypothetical protein